MAPQLYLQRIELELGYLGCVDPWMALHSIITQEAWGEKRGVSDGSRLS